MSTFIANTAGPIALQGAAVSSEAGATLTSEARPIRPFACLFYKFNPEMYDECKRHQFKRISDIKQHLVRRHSLPTYSCPVCWSPFTDEQSKTDHLRHANCQQNPQPEELSPEEVNNLKRRGGGIDVIWSQLFPGFQAPLPYIQSNSIEEFKNLLYPSVETSFRTNLPLLMQTNTPEFDLSSFVKFILDSACHSFCSSLPKSRHTSPSSARVHNDTKVDGSPIPTFNTVPCGEHTLSNNNMDSGAGLNGDAILDNAEINMLLDYDDFGLYFDN